MNPTIQALLNGTEKNNILPFFWQHGEDEETLRHYMNVIHDSGCGAVCVESRPHPDFCGPKWWQDMDVIIDEAKKLHMRVWILDDDHFPTGHANGAVEHAPETLCRQSIYNTYRDYVGKSECIQLLVSELATPPEYPKNQMQVMIERMNPPNHRFYHDDRLLSVIAVRMDAEVDFGSRIDLLPLIQDGKLSWEKPDGTWRIYASGLSRNYGPHRSYINMMDMDSCKILIDAVYEPHYLHYKKEFGKTIAGFFSDEPELGNGQLYALGNTLGTPQDLPWSKELENELRVRLGDAWTSLMPLLWENEADSRLTAFVRSCYMDSVTRLVERCFSMQIGDWCAERGVMYIGHVVEDCNQDARTASSLGHFYRGLAGQHMAGIDNIGGQVLPQGEDEPTAGIMGRERDGTFYHFALGKLAASHAAIDPRKKGRAMCEIFGNYGWGAGVQLEKYLVDHFLVRGINHMVPHAFNPKAYPDRDCPPHFYAHGHNPQHRHFGELMRYTNRVCQLLSGGTRIAPVAVLYHAEAEWAGGSYMLSEVPVRKLMENQIDLDIIPSDVFANVSQYHTNVAHGLRVNTQVYKALVIPAAQYLSDVAAKAAVQLYTDGFPVFFVDRRPDGVCSGKDCFRQLMDSIPVVPLHELPDYLRGIGAYDITAEPSCRYLRYLHYQNEGDIYLFVNEGTDVYEGNVYVKNHGKCSVYDAWHNRIETATSAEDENGTILTIRVEPRKSLMILFDEQGLANTYTAPMLSGRTIELGNWQRALCKSIEYPNFGPPEPVVVPDSLASQKPNFSGYARYETTFHLDEIRPAVLEIENASEGVEVFVNGVSAGIQIVAPYRYDLSGLVKAGLNTLAIEVATTLEREYHASISNEIEKMRAGNATSASGITGSVTLMS